jgi:hypothetical protein
MAYMMKSLSPFELDTSPLPHTDGRHVVNSVSFSCTLIRSAAISRQFVMTGQPNVDKETGKQSGARGHEFSLMKHVQAGNWKIIADYDIKTEHRVITEPEAQPTESPEQKQKNTAKENFIKTKHCSSRVHCNTCRNSQVWRDSLRQQYWVPPDFDTHCPNGMRSGTRTMAEMAMTAAGAIGRAASAALQGQQVLTSRPEILRRWGICMSCAAWYIPDQKRCKQCGCYLDAKIMLATEKCPVDHWQAEAVENAKTAATAAATPVKRPCGGCRKHSKTV